MWLNESRWKNILFYLTCGVLITLAVILVLAFLLSNFPKTGKYTIYSNQAAAPMLLDTETGKSWIYSDYAWKPISKVKEETILDLDLTQENAKLQDEIRNLKIKHELEIKEINAKQEAELNLLRSKKEEPCKIGVKSQKLQPKYKFVAKNKKDQPDSDEDFDLDTGEDTRAPVF